MQLLFPTKFAAQLPSYSNKRIYILFHQRLVDVTLRPYANALQIIYTQLVILSKLHSEKQYAFTYSLVFKSCSLVLPAFHIS